MVQVLGSLVYIYGFNSSFAIFYLTAKTRLQSVFTVNTILTKFWWNQKTCICPSYVVVFSWLGKLGEYCFGHGQSSSWHAIRHGNEYRAFSGLGLKNRSLFALLAWKLGGSVGQLFLKVFSWNLDTDDIQYNSCVCILGYAEPQNRQFAHIP